MTRIELFYDVVSPWSYIAFEVLFRLEKEWDVNITLQPVFLAGIMQATGNKPPATVPAKASYGFVDLARTGKHYGIPISMPSVFPTNTISCQRLLQVLKKGSKIQYNLILNCYLNSIRGKNERFNQCIQKLLASLLGRKRN